MTRKSSNSIQIFGNKIKIWEKWVGENQGFGQNIDSLLLRSVSPSSQMVNGLHL